MSNETEEGYVFFRAGCIALVMIIMSMGGCLCTQNYQDDKAIAELVSHGAKPLEAACSIRMANGGHCEGVVAKSGGQ